MRRIPNFAVTLDTEFTRGKKMYNKTVILKKSGDYNGQYQYVPSNNEGWDYFYLNGKTDSNTIHFSLQARKLTIKPTNFHITYPVAFKQDVFRLHVNFETSTFPQSVEYKSNNLIECPPIPTGLQTNAKDYYNNNLANLKKAAQEFATNVWNSKKLDYQPLRSKVVGAQETELDQVISDLPWQDSFYFGFGVDAITGNTSGSAIKPFTPQERTVKSSSEHYRFVQSDSDLNREVEASASGKYNIEGITINASASYLSKIEYCELRMTLVAEYQTSFSGYDEAESYELTDEAEQLINDPAKFRKSYGDYFVAGGRRGSRILAVYVCQASSIESMDDFKACFGGEAPEVFSIEGSSRFMQAASQNDINISVDIFMEGYVGQSPSGPWTPEKIMDAQQWFKAHEKGIYIKAKLNHYSTIVASYPRSIDVSPDVFVELRQLYTTIWDVRSRYASTPEYYRNQLKMEYTNVNYGVVSHQDILVTDAEKRSSYLQKANLLLSDLQQLSIECFT
jgi:hypothetical protein